jgi:hypothetical protein
MSILLILCYNGSYPLKYGVKNSVRTSQETHDISATKPNRLILFREINGVYSEMHAKHLNALRGETAELLMLKKMVHIVTTTVNFSN